MKTNKLLFVVAVLVGALLSSCAQQHSSEYYAQKENGLEFNSWILKYEADDNYIYWPHLERTIAGVGKSVKTYGRKEFETFDASLTIEILNRQSLEDATRKDIVLFSPKWRFSGNRVAVVINPGQGDSLVFAAGSRGDRHHNGNGYSPVDEKVNEKLISILFDNGPANITINGEDSFTNYTLSCEIIGGSEFKKGITRNRDRSALAEEEYKVIIKNGGLTLY